MAVRKRKRKIDPRAMPGGMHVYGRDKKQDAIREAAIEEYEITGNPDALDKMYDRPGKPFKPTPI